VLTVVAGDLLADRVGRAEPRVLALHGWARSGADFGQVLAGTDALAIHLPGFGVTPTPPEPWGTVEYADHLADALAGSGPFVVVGHSFGGRVAVRLAVRHPELVSSIVLTGAPLVRATPPPKPSLLFRTVKALRAAHLLPQSVLDRLRKNSGSDDYRAAEGVMRGVFVRVVGEDYREDLAALSVPVHLVWGELDDSAPLAGARLAAGIVPGARLDVVPGEGHLMTGALQDAVRTAMLDQLASAGSTAGPPPSTPEPSDDGGQTTEESA